MLWAVLSLIIALVLSGLGFVISEDTFDIFGKVIFWLVVVVFLNAQLLHLIHLVHVRDGA
jgi:hypothetical protein